MIPHSFPLEELVPSSAIRRLTWTLKRVQVIGFANDMRSVGRSESPKARVFVGTLGRVFSLSQLNSRWEELHSIYRGRPMTRSDEHLIEGGNVGDRIVADVTVCENFAAGN